MVYGQSVGVSVCRAVVLHTRFFARSFVLALRTYYINAWTFPSKINIIKCVTSSCIALHYMSSKHRWYCDIFSSLVCAIDGVFVLPISLHCDTCTRYTYSVHITHSIHYGLLCFGRYITFVYNFFSLFHSLALCFALTHTHRSIHLVVGSYFVYLSVQIAITLQYTFEYIWSACGDQSDENYRNIYEIDAAR